MVMASKNIRCRELVCILVIICTEFKNVKTFEAFQMILFPVVAYLCSEKPGWLSLA